jgi:hypothetical protein
MAAFLLLKNNSSEVFYIENHTEKEVLIYKTKKHSNITISIKAKGTAWIETDQDEILLLNERKMQCKKTSHNNDCFYEVHISKNGVSCTPECMKQF